MRVKQSYKGLGERAVDSTTDPLTLTLCSLQGARGVNDYARRFAGVEIVQESGLK